MYSVVDFPLRHPGKCQCCGAGADREWYIDLGEDNNSPGVDLPTVYVCNQCLTAMGKEVGLVYEAPILAVVEALRSELFDAKVKAEGLEDGLNGLLRARFIDPESPTVAELVSFLEGLESSTDSEPGASGENPDGAQVSGGGVGSPEGDAPEPGHGQDLGAVPGLFGQHGGAA